MLLVAPFRHGVWVDLIAIFLQNHACNGSIAIYTGSHYSNRTGIHMMDNVVQHRPASPAATWSARLDTIGFWASVACAVHCIALPLLVVLMPMLGLGVLLDITLERVFVVATIVLASVNLCWGFTIHRKARVLFMLAAGAAMLVSAVFVLPHSHAVVTTVAAGDHAGHGHHDDAIHIAHAGGVTAQRPQNSTSGLLLLIAGAAGIAGSHLVNRRLCRTCVKCHAHHDH